MIRKLRKKFILIASFSLLAILVVVLGITNAVNYYNARVEIFSVLNMISESGGKIPDKLYYRSIIGESVLTGESAYALRFFSAYIDEDDGSIHDINRERVSAINENEAQEYVQRAMKLQTDEGFIRSNGSVYAYQKSSFYGGNVLCVIMDCTRAVAPMVRNMEAQKQFITNASHELKTPLAIISANTEVLEMTEGKNEWTESTMEQVKRMSELISHLIVLSRLQEKDEIELTQVDFSAVTSKVTEEFRILAEKDGKSYETVITEGRMVKANEAGVRELISILCDNAVKYCTDGGTVRITLEPKGQHASVLTVSNTYPENKDVDYSRFFERFYREDESHNSEKKGFGIGLSMAERIVETFKGKISVHYKDSMIHFVVILS